MTPKKDNIAVCVRVTREMHDAIKAESEAQSRTMSAFINLRLKEYFKSK
jgi:hypothetical protein